MELRNSKRKSSVISPLKPAQETVHTQSTTPAIKRPNKKLRFSDTVLLNDSTGLTPFVGKASLQTPKHRRASTPAITRYEHHDEVQFTPFRECLTPRTVRQIKRHGLSDEMNQYYADQKTNAALRKELEVKNRELQDLQDELAQALARNDPLHDVSSSQGRVDEVQAEIEQLQQSFSSNDGGFEETGASNDSLSGAIHDDDCGFLIYEDENVGNENQSSEDDAHDVDLELESARQAKQALFRSSQGSSTAVVHFEDSPARPRTTQKDIPPQPQQSHLDMSKLLNAGTNRAEEAEVALKALDLEIQSLGFPSNNNDAHESVAAIKNHFREMRIELERVIPGETVTSFDNAKLMPEMLVKIKMIGQSVRDREGELKSMREQQRCLKGNFDHAIVAAEKANNRVKELEETIDKNAEEMLEIRMRAQAWEREAKENESNNRALITAIEKYREEVKRLEQLVGLIEAEQASRLQDVRTATEAEFTQQVSDMDAKVAAETHGRRAAEESAVDRLRKINELESALSTARQQADDVKEQLASLEQQLNHSTREQLASSERAHEEEVGGLNSRIANLSTALNSANAEVDKLKKLNAKLEERYRAEVEYGARSVDRMYNEVIRSATKASEERKSYIRGAKVRYANWELESDDLVSDPIVAPMTPASIVRFSDIDYPDDHIQGSVEVSRGKKKHSRASGQGLGIMKRDRRSYDSGIGMDSVSEADEEAMSDDIMTPDLSSEADVEYDVDVMV
ncbi:hypothetical protein LTR10_022822 [Elasticomyces elasticus]|uniref:Uncharacterized protein n=1 Tax=Exophiala sideris TaxID=1016849 RepID=A0ABR0JAP5_9EURO|nr:hypothetical protein LTR10_022822 [Elasticomyces elasticus]KAK5026162.1 hypothetical protein LTS07_007687 [Exophiala sideris]KAK5032416.1 hypothetical protein LTR13_007239 [Exophiala sideris]KAK5059572.1 hypothetical protein LTR69_006161 [Exophiala sideris]KAK5178145.1 hypothetical protein LTR44_009451 [Eurotiomycetes sp. CCFEE 6388]